MSTAEAVHANAPAPTPVERGVDTREPTHLDEGVWSSLEHARHATGFGAPRGLPPPAPVQRAVLSLQRTAGNRAVASMLGKRVQRERTAADVWNEQMASRAPVIPDELQLKPDDSGKDPSTMTWRELENAIDEHKRFIEQKRQSDPKREERLRQLYAAKEQLAIKAGSPDDPRGGRRRTKDRSALPERPRSLSGSLNLAEMKPEAIRRELDLVVAYLAARPPKAERDALMADLPALEQAAGAARDQRQDQKRLDAAVDKVADKAGGEDTLLEALRAVDGASRDPAAEDMWLVRLDGQFYPLRTGQLQGLRKALAQALVSTAAQVNSILWDTRVAWEGRTGTNRKQYVVHWLVKLRTGAKDIPESDIKQMVSVGDSYVNRVRSLGFGGQLVAAAEQVGLLQQYARYWANKVGEWESQLVRSAGYWVIALTLVKEALTIWMGVRAASYIAGASGPIATLKAAAQVTGVAGTTGAVVGGTGAYFTGQDVERGVRLGTGAGIGVATNAIAGSASKYASVKDAVNVTGLAKKSVAVGKAVGVETGINVLGGVAKAGVEKTSVKEAAAGSAVTGTIGSLGGGIVDAYAATRTAQVAGKGLVGTIGGYAGAKASNQDALVGTLTGLGGGLYSGGKASLPAPAPAPATGNAALTGGGPAPALTSGEAGASPTTTAAGGGEPAPTAGGTEPGTPTGGAEPAPTTGGTESAPDTGLPARGGAPTTGGGSARDVAVTSGAIPPAPKALPEAGAAAPTSGDGAVPAGNAKTVEAAGGQPEVPGALAQVLEIARRDAVARGLDPSRLRITNDDINGGTGWKLVRLKAGEEFEFEAFGPEGKTSFKWVARVPEENWEWAQRGNQLVPSWYTGGGTRRAVMVRYRIKLTADVDVAMSKVAEQSKALGRLGPAKFQYFTPLGFEAYGTPVRGEAVRVLLPTSTVTREPKE